MEGARSPRGSTAVGSSIDKCSLASRALYDQVQVTMRDAVITEFPVRKGARVFADLFTSARVARCAEVGTQAMADQLHVVYTLRSSELWQLWQLGRPIRPSSAPSRAVHICKPFVRSERHALTLQNLPFFSCGTSR